jgi:acetylglutamate kinase
MSVDRTREVIHQLLENIGGRKEVAEYLRHYTGVDTQRFAVVTFARDVDVIARAPDVASALSFLHEVGLYPIVVLGGQAAALTLADALEERGCRARPMSSIDNAAVVSALRAKTLPIIGVDNGLLAAVRTLAAQIEPQKIVLLDNDGGLHGSDGHRIDAINLAEDEANLDRLLDGAQRERLDRFIPLLEDLPHFVSLSVTSPAHLARELFTHRGAGTLVRRGERVLAHESFDDVDKRRVRELIVSCFDRQLIPEYFVKKECHRIYLTQSYRATAVLTRDGDLPPYLDKFAVTRKAQGEGLGGSLWARIRADNPKLFWRSRTDNPVNGWYFQQADGTYKTEQWTVFWYGLADFAEIERCVNDALSQPATLSERATLSPPAT